MSLDGYLEDLAGGQSPGEPVIYSVRKRSRAPDMEERSHS